MNIECNQNCYQIQSDLGVLTFSKWDLDFHLIQFRLKIAGTLFCEYPLCKLIAIHFKFV